MEKPCFKCGEVKHLSAFYKHPQMPDGHLNKCKECNKQDVRDNYHKRHDQYMAYERKRRPRTKQQVSYLTDKDRIERKLVTTKVGNAIRDGKLTKGACEVCGSVERVHAHHDDYGKPLEVRWLCPKHHYQVHMHNDNIWQAI